MKKSLVCSVLVVALLAFSGCSEDEDTGENNNTTPPPTPTQDLVPPQTINMSVIKKTGQTVSYAEDGSTSISIKDDGHYKTGVPANYTKASDMVTDELTKLMWQDDADASSLTKQWQTDANYNSCKKDISSSSCEDTSGDTAATYCLALTLGGYTDWRVPNIEELETIIDYTNPITDNFNHIKAQSYWSSSTSPGFKYLAWDVFFGYGIVSSIGEKNHSSYVRCVRGGK